MSPRQLLRSLIVFVGSRAPAALFRKSALMLKAFRFFLAGHKPIIVLGGHYGESFDDNSRAMALHLAEDGGYRVYWVHAGARNKAVSRAGITQIRRGSVWTELVATSAHCLLYSHGLSDVTMATDLDTPWRKIIYLGHGVWGFKRIERRDGSQARKAFDVTIAASLAECALKARVLSCSESQILPVGLPKHDALITSRTRRPPDRVRHVLYAPTWRDWLQHHPSDKALDLHFKALADLAQSMPATTPDGHPMKMTYLVHKNIRDITDRATRAARPYNVNVALSHEVDVNALLQNADYLITDYSALFWDFIVQKRPAALFQFDRDIYDALTGSYPEIETRTLDVQFSNLDQLWAFLLSAQAEETACRLAECATQYSIGRACEQLTLVMDRLIEGDEVALGFARVPGAERQGRGFVGRIVPAPNAVTGADRSAQRATQNTHWAVHSAFASSR